MRTLVIIPTYNERENLQPLVEAVLAVDSDLHILVVDDNSPDGTGDLAERLARDTGRVYVLHRAGKQGLGTAYLAGFKYALQQDYGFIVEMDADFSHRPEDLPRLLAAARGADVVVGSRSVQGGRVENWSLLRRVISRGGSLYARLALGLTVRDCTSGFKCFRRDVLAKLNLDGVHSNGFGFQVEMNYLCQRAGFQLAEVPIIFPDRRAGVSKMSGRIFIEAFALVWRLRLRSVEAHVAPRAEQLHPSPGVTNAMANDPGLAGAGLGHSWPVAAGAQPARGVPSNGDRPAKLDFDLGSPLKDIRDPMLVGVHEMKGIGE
jgi:dolichol-phosphate mannosyltransferase